MSNEETVPHQGAEPPPDPATAAPAAVRRRRRGLRTAGLIAVAAVVGLVGGTAVGYRVQADRAPAPLPPLNQPGLAYPAKPLPEGQEPEPLSAAEDRQAKRDGDLSKLLLPKPAGARLDGDDGWQSPAQYVEGFTRPQNALRFQLGLGVRRIATRSWWEGERRRVEIDLVQYRPGDKIGAAELVRDQQGYTGDEMGIGGAAGRPVKGSGNGRYYVLPVQREAGYEDLYAAHAFAQRGDVAITIFMSDTRKIADKDIRSLIERQLERL